MSDLREMTGMPACASSSRRSALVVRSRWCTSALVSAATTIAATTAPAGFAMKPNAGYHRSRGLGGTS